MISVFYINIINGYFYRKYQKKDNILGLKAVIFDFDGTLTKQGAIDFPYIRKTTGCPEGAYLLDYFNTLPAVKKREAEKLLDHHEYKAAINSEEEESAGEVIQFFNSRDIPSVIISRNSRKCVLKALENFSNTEVKDFYKIITRDDPFPVKPDPASIRHIAEELNINCREILVVGDYLHDIDAGKSAGCTTAYKVTGRKNDHLVHSDFTISHLNELKDIYYTLSSKT